MEHFSGQIPYFRSRNVWIKTGSSCDDDIIVTIQVSIDVELKPESIYMSFGVTYISGDVIITKLRF